MRNSRNDNNLAFAIEHSDPFQGRHMRSEDTSYNLDIDSHAIVYVSMLPTTLIIEEME